MQILRFLLIGSVGFLVDAAVLVASMELLDLDRFAGRAVSFALAVLVTWFLNRGWSFATPHPPRLGEFLQYVSSQGTGLGINIAVFATVSLFTPAPINRPVLALAIASAAALVVNYLALRHFVFRTRPPS